MSRVRLREIKEGIVIGLALYVILAIVSAVLNAVAHLPLRSSLTWFWTVVSKPIGVPLGVLLFVGALLLPVVLQIVWQSIREPAPVPFVGPASTGAMPNATSLTADESSILLTFGSTGRTNLPIPELSAAVRLSDIRLTLALDELLNRGLIEHHPANFALSRQPSAYLTHEGRAWLVDNGYA